MGQNIVVIGGGVGGLMSAYQLDKLGHSVTVIDKGDITNNTSFGNAGLLSAWEKPPLSRPGIVGDTIKLMLKSKSPISIRPTLDSHVYKWLMRFVLSSTKARLKKSLALFEKYGDMALEEYLKIIKEEDVFLDLHQDGVYMVYTDKKSYLEKVAHANDPQKYEVLSYEEAKRNLGFVKDNVEGIINLKRNVRINPALVMQNMKKILEKKGVNFIFNEEIVDWEVGGNGIKRAVGKQGSYEADTFILSCGADTTLAKKVGTSLMLTPAKGHSITFNMDESIKPKQCVMFGDLFIICTPRKDDMRFTSKLELGSQNKNVDMKMVESILKNLKEYCVDFEIKEPKYWTGFRPLTPNDMPLIGRDEKYRNLVYTMGLGWLGMTFGPALGKIVSRLIHEDLDNKQSDDILLFSGFYQGCL